MLHGGSACGESVHSALQYAPSSLARVDCGGLPLLQGCPMEGEPAVCRLMRGPGKELCVARAIGLGVAGKGLV